MSKKKYDFDAKKYKGCNKTRGWLLTEEQIALIRFYLCLAGLEFQFEARRNLRKGMPKNIVLHEMRKYREVTALYNDIANLKPHVYEMVSSCL